MFLGAFGFLYMGIVGGCSQPVPDLCYQIEVDKPLQTMDYFGASDAWSMQPSGTNWFMAAGKTKSDR